MLLKKCNTTQCKKILSVLQIERFIVVNSSYEGGNTVDGVWQELSNMDTAVQYVNASAPYSWTSSTTMYAGDFAAIKIQQNGYQHDLNIPATTSLITADLVKLVPGGFPCTYEKIKQPEYCGYNRVTLRGQFHPSCLSDGAAIIDQAFVLTKTEIHRVRAPRSCNRLRIALGTDTARMLVYTVATGLRVERDQNAARLYQQPMTGFASYGVYAVDDLGFLDVRVGGYTGGSVKCFSYDPMACSPNQVFGSTLTCSLLGLSTRWTTTSSPLGPPLPPSTPRTTRSSTARPRMSACSLPTLFAKASPTSRSAPSRLIPS